MTDRTNDNELPPAVPGAEESDTHGRAAMLLVESLIHGLIARSVIRIEDAIEVVTVAIDVRMEMAADRGDSQDATDRSLGLLSAIRRSLNNDV